MALSCLNVAADLDIEVPKSLSIVGFDDIPEAVQAGLTTIRQPVVEKGVAAAKMINEILQHVGDMSEPKRKVFATRLIMRTSTGPAPAPAKAAR
jgi:DNA-binding LacI/PurR family transcriptional regulator